MARRTALYLAAAVAASALAADRVRAAPLPDSLKPPGFATPKLTRAEFEKIHAAVAPRGEGWEQIPWETELAAARQRAAKEKKPLLLWIMDGHPLGCT